MSPDGNYVAFTKNNDLYSINLQTKKLTRLTEDGSEVILMDMQVGCTQKRYLEEFKLQSIW